MIPPKLHIFHTLISRMYCDSNSLQKKSQNEKTKEVVLVKIYSWILHVIIVCIKDINSSLFSDHHN
jgi:hypothetical protein